MSVRSTESSTVATMRCCERRPNCSARREKHELEVKEGLPVAEDLLGNLTLWGDGSNVRIGGRALIPHKGSLKEAVKQRE